MSRWTQQIISRQTTAPADADSREEIHRRTPGDKSEPKGPVLYLYELLTRVCLWLYNSGT